MTINPTWQPSEAGTEGLDWGKVLETPLVAQEKTEISLSRALLVPEGVARAPSLYRAVPTNTV